MISTSSSPRPHTLSIAAHQNARHFNYFSIILSQNEYEDGCQNYLISRHNFFFVRRKTGCSFASHVRPLYVVACGRPGYLDVTRHRHWGGLLPRGMQQAQRMARGLGKRTLHVGYAVCQSVAA